MNRGLATAMTALGLAQALKVPIEYARKGKWNFAKLVETGGMPSSHSAAVSSLAAYVALKRGLCSVDFAISTIFGLIVMYDAMGIRRHAGEIAVEVNDLKVEVEQLADHHPGVYHEKKEKELKEMLGHLPEEVIGGCLLGIGLGTVSYITSGK
jgi:acid phosphatase family membrane protein YuiD